MQVSYELLGVLGGVSKQAAYKSSKRRESPKRFLIHAVERALSSTSTEMLVSQVGERLALLSSPKRLGRKQARDPEALASLVGVPYQGEDLLGVFAAFVAKVASLR